MNKIYLKADKKTIITKKKVTIEEIGQITGDNLAIVNKIKKMQIFLIKEDKKKNYVVSIIDIIELIRKAFNNIEIINVGESDFIVCYWPDINKENKIITYIKVVIICLTLFCGAAIAIMTFHTDAAIPDVFREIYKIFTGKLTNSPTILDVSYSIGLAIGIIVFFNHFSTVHIMDDPTPIEVEMRMYEKDVEDSILEALTDERKNLNDD